MYVTFHFLPLINRKTSWLLNFVVATYFRTNPKREIIYKEMNEYELYCYFKIDVNDQNVQ